MVLAEFRPKDTFAAFEHRFSGENPSYAVVGPNAAAIGWIPYYSDPGQLPEGELRDRWKDDVSLGKVLESGNRQPPPRFSGPGDFMRDLELNDFRAAIALDQPTLFLNQDRRPVLLQFSAMARLGYTPVSWKAAILTKYFEGTGSACCHLLNDSIHLRLFVRFKLCFLGQLAARSYTGQWPPNATATIDYAMDPENGRAEITFTGTVVPQLTSYVGWKAVHEYRMENLSCKTYDSFLYSPGCQDALNRPGHKEIVTLTWIEIGKL